ncbi:MAG TPA: hypothetical protein VIU39_13720, partial [Anaerolineales bacterium]
MYHLQRTVPNWLDALPLLPDDLPIALIKGFEASMLWEAKERWMALGRSPLTLRTLFRHSDIQTVPRGSTWDEAKDHWRRMFARFVDRTYLEHYASHIDLINEANEYTALSTWRDDPDHGALALMNMQAAAWVWNNEYRGRLV